jgi:hypothetical protein
MPYAQEQMETDERLVNIRRGSEEGGILTSIYQAYAAVY